MNEQAPIKPTPPQLGALLILLCYFTWQASTSWGTLVDDAFISARYAENFADGFGLVYSAGEPPVEGYTNLAWTVALGLGRMMGLPIVTLMTSLGWIFAVVAIYLSMRLTQTISGSASWAALIPPALMATSPHLAVACTNGLESSMMLAAGLLAIQAHLTLPTNKRWVSGLLAGSLYSVRPEGLAIALGLATHELWCNRHRLRDALPFLCTAALVVVTLTVWRLYTYGMYLPNTFYAKSSFEITETFKVNDRYLTPEQGPLLTGLALGVTGAVLPKYSWNKALIICLAVGLWCIPMSVNLWMPGLRLFLLPMTLSAILLASSVSALPKGPAIFLAASLLSLAAFQEPTSGKRVRAYDKHHSVQPDNPVSLAMRLIAPQLPKGEVVATRDAGVLAYYAGTHVSVAETHQRALTQPHPEGANAAIRSYTPANPGLIAVTIRDAGQQPFVYGNDRLVFTGTKEEYVYLGRVYQHFRRHYDLYMRADLNPTPLPRKLIANFKGYKAPRSPKDSPGIPNQGKKKKRQ